jgi:uncharacterized protein (TIGR03435 family)
MLRGLAAVVLASGFGLPLSAQADRALVFEVATLKPSPPPTGPIPIPIPHREGGPGTADPSQIRYRNIPLPQLLTVAYGVDPGDIVGPEWAREVVPATTSDKYDIDAVLPPQTTDKQLQIMLQKLLIARFAILAHREKKTVAAYALAVASGGLKIKPDEVPEDPEARQKLDVTVKGDDGFPVTLPGYNGLFVRAISGYTRVKFIRYSMDQFAKWTRVNTNRPGIDRTGLTGRYSFYLEFGDDIGIRTTDSGTVPEPLDRGQSFPSAIEKQLGLKLIADNAEIELLVIDNINRVPSGN